MKNPRYTCPREGCNRSELIQTENGLQCPESCINRISIPFAESTNTPIFTSQDENLNEYSKVNAAEIHDNSLKWLFSTFKSSEADLRNNLIARLKIKPGIRVLITGAGAGNDIPFFIAALKGEGEIYAQDIAKEMLLWGENRIRGIYSKTGISLFFSVSDAMNLPFENGFFDAAYHFGGINLFSNQKRGIAEMYRVVRDGGRVLFGDEGIAPWLRSTEESKILINNTHLYGYEPPLDMLPITARDVELTWELSNCFYVVSLTVSSLPLTINIDVPHVGRRGGSMRTRYYGELEGIDPCLRNAVYERAEALGISRVEFIESVFRAVVKPEE